MQIPKFKKRYALLGLIAFGLAGGGFFLFKGSSPTSFGGAGLSSSGILAPLPAQQPVAPMRDVAVPSTSTRTTPTAQTETRAKIRSVKPTSDTRVYVETVTADTPLPPERSFVELITDPPSAGPTGGVPSVAPDDWGSGVPSSGIGGAAAGSPQQMTFPTSVVVPSIVVVNNDTRNGIPRVPPSVPPAVPEPAAWLLFFHGIVMLGIASRFRKSK